MTGQTDDKNGERAAKRATLDVALSGGATKTEAVSKDVAEDVARVVNLLQRLDKLHSRPMPLGPAGGRLPPVLQAPPRSTGTDGLSSLSTLRDRSAHRAAPPAPVPYLVPPALPPALLPAAAPLVPAAEVLLDALPAVLTNDDLKKSEPHVSQAVKPGPDERRTKPDRAPLALIVSVIVGVVVLGAWGLMGIQNSSSTVRLASSAPPAVTTTVPVQARLDTAGMILPPTLGEAGGITLAGCGTVALAAAKGVVTLAVTDPARVGQALSVAVGDLAFKAAFGPAGRLEFKAPLLAETATVRWTGGTGTQCERVATLPADGALLRVALVWSGEAALDLHVIEPNAWYGGPSGHISNLAPNADKVRGAGSVEAFGSRGGTVAIVYAVDPARISAGGIINAFVKPAGSATVACSDPANPAPESQVTYQVHILRSAAGGGLQREVQSFSMQLASCGGSSTSPVPSERIMVRN